MSKTAKVILTALILVLTISFIGSSKAHADDIQDIDIIIEKGLSITDAYASEAYVWAADVSEFIEKHKDSSVYQYIKYLCGEIKNYSLTSSNAKNKIIGALSYLKSVLNCESSKSPLTLIDESTCLTDAYAPEVYEWAFNVEALAKNYPDSSVYNNLIYLCGEIKNYSLTSSNAKNKIIADLTVLDNETIASSLLTDMRIAATPNKLTYVEGETFSPDGLRLIATFMDIHKDGTTVSSEKPVINYIVDTSTKLKIDDTKWVISYTYEGKTISVYQDITVTKTISASEYNNKTVTGSDVKKAINDFANEKVAILVNNLAFNETATTGSPHIIQSSLGAENYNKTTVSTIEMSGNRGETSSGKVSGYTTNGKDCCNIWFVNYNAILGVKNMSNGRIEITKNLAIKDLYMDTITGDYILLSGFATSDNGDVQYYLNSKVSNDKNSALYIDDDATYQSNLIKDKEGNTLGIVFLQKTLGSSYTPSLLYSSITSISVASKPKKTEYVIGEAFNPKGLKVNAKYKNEWSDGSVTYTTKKNVDYTVDTETPLKKSDKKWVITVKNLQTSVKIKVKSSTPKLNKTKLTLTPGDVFQLKVYGTEKYVMWTSEGDVTVTSDGLVKVSKTGTGTITATVGSGKKNTKLKCKVTVKPKLTADKSVIFLEMDEYETITVDTSKLAQNESFQLYPGRHGYVNLVLENDNTYNIVPKYTSYTEMILYSISSNGTKYVQTTIPTFVYNKNYKDDAAVYYYSYGNYQGIKAVRFSFDGDNTIIIADSDLAANFNKNSHYDKNNDNVRLISKEKFEKIIKKAIKENALIY